jgi:hypothetical protein
VPPDKKIIDRMLKKINQKIKSGAYNKEFKKGKKQEEEKKQNKENMKRITQIRHQESSGSIHDLI